MTCGHQSFNFQCHEVQSFNICEKVSKNSSFYIEMPVFFTNIFEQWLKTVAHAQWMCSRLSMCSRPL
jgi:hypothetical protein